MGIVFEKVSFFKRGILYSMLADAYSFDCRIQESCEFDWLEFDNFFFDNLQIADKCGFITKLYDEPIGFVSWDPRNMPEYVEIGHNCIVSKYKGNGYGRAQLQEAVNRILQGNVSKIIVTTNEALIPARRMYERVGFKIQQNQENKNLNSIDFAGDLIDYVYYVQ